MATLTHHKLFFDVAFDNQEYIHDIYPSAGFLAQTGADIYTFIERGWCFSYKYNGGDLPIGCKTAPDNVAVLPINSYAEWLKEVKHKTHHDPVKRALNKGVTVQAAYPDYQLAYGIYMIYNETPIRQNRRFSGYGKKLDDVLHEVAGSPDIFIAAYFDGGLVGFCQLVEGKETLVVTQLLSFVAYQEKSINKALLAKAVEVAANMGKGWIVYARMGNHQSLDRFKRENGFLECRIQRFYLPLTRRGKVALALGLHRDLKDVLPGVVKNMVYPVYCWVSRRMV